MSKRSKSLRAADAKIDREKLYAPLEAVRLAKETSISKFDGTVEIAFRLGVDPRKADQMVRGTVNLPHGTGKTARVLVFATGDRAAAAEAAGADIVGSDELIDEVAKGRLDFDAVVATPDLMGKVGRLGRVLGPRGLMPNPKTGTVTPDVAKAVTEIKGGKIEFRVDKHSNLHFIIGKASFDDTQLVENYGAALDEILRLKPSVRRQGSLHQEGRDQHHDRPRHPDRPEPHPEPPRRGGPGRGLNLTVRPAGDEPRDLSRCGARPFCRTGVGAVRYLANGGPAGTSWG
ncbi:large subunit ribosomal protein L1 [Streptomyces phaeoluteigriseus]